MKNIYEARDKFKSVIAYSVIGAYAEGAAKDVAHLGPRMTSKDLGKSICHFENRPALDPFNMITDDFKNAPNRRSLLKRLIDYGVDSLEKDYQRLALSNLSEEAKLEVFKEETKKILAAVKEQAYGEGLADEELKEDISLILKEGREKFIQRDKEARAKEPAEITEAPLPGTDELANENQEQSQDGFGFEDQGQGSFGDMGDEAQFGADDQAQENQEFGDFQSADFGFNDTSTDDQQGGSALDQAGDAMSQFSNNNGEEEEAKAEAYLINAARHMTAPEINKLIKGKSFSEAGLKSLMENYNFSRSSEEEFKYIYKGQVTTMDKPTIDGIVDTLLTAESALFDISMKEGDITGIRENYSKVSSNLVGSVATILTTRHILKID